MVLKFLRRIAGRDEERGVHGEKLSAVVCKQDTILQEDIMRDVIITWRWVRLFPSDSLVYYMPL